MGLAERQLHVGSTVQKDPAREARGAKVPQSEARGRLSHCPDTEVGGGEIFQCWLEPGAGVSWEQG